MPLDTGEYPNVPGLGTALQWLPEALYYAELHALGVPSAEEQLNMAKMLLSGIAPESGGDVNAAGDNGRSHGIWQIYQVHGLSVEDRQNPHKAFQWRMTHPEGVEQMNITQHLHNYLSQGYEYGPQLASALLGKVQVSNPAYHHRYGKAWDLIDGALGGATTGEQALKYLKNTRYGLGLSSKTTDIGGQEDEEPFPLEGVVAISPGTKMNTGVYDTGPVVAKHDKGRGKRVRGITFPPRDLHSFVKGIDYG